MQNNVAESSSGCLAVADTHAGRVINLPSEIFSLISYFLDVFFCVSGADQKSFWSFFMEGSINFSEG